MGIRECYNDYIGAESWAPGVDVDDLSGDKAPCFSLDEMEHKITEIDPNLKGICYRPEILTFGGMTREVWQCLNNFNCIFVRELEMFMDFDIGT